MVENYPRIWCPRCGHLYTTCPHAFTRVAYDVDDDEAARIRARYAIGRVHNPDHDETSYRDPEKSPGPIFKHVNV